MSKPAILRRVTKALRINSISAVDSPANEKSVATIIKRKATDEEIAALLKSTSDNMPEVDDPEDAKDGGADELTEGDRTALNQHYTNKAAEHAQNAAYHASSGRTQDAADASKKAQRALRDAKRFAPIAKSADDDVAKRNFDAKQRESAAKSGAAMSDGSFPIESGADLSNAIQAIGRAKNRAAVAKHIKARARALGMTDKLPSSGDLAISKGIGDDPLDIPTGDDDVADDAKLIEVQKRLDDSAKEVAKLRRVAEMTDAEKAFMKSLPADEHDGFVVASVADRSAKIAKAKEGDPVIYKSPISGREFRKSMDPLTIELAKQGDETAAELKKSKDALAEASYAKRVADLPHLPGSAEENVALLKSIDAIADEKVRAAQLAHLSKLDSGLAKAFERAGVNGGTDVAKAGSPEAVAEQAIGEIMKSKSVDRVRAAAEFWESPRGRELRNAKDATRPNAYA